jgi:hypothetical protein
MERVFIPVLALAPACGGPTAAVDGNIGTEPFTVESLYHAGPYILLFDREIDCVDTAFVAAAYSEGTALSEDDFVALQFFTENEAFEAGTYSVEGDAVVSADGLVNLDQALDTHRGREGTLTIVETDAENQWIEGSFDVQFTDSGVSGEFRTAYCRNMQP